MIPVKLKKYRLSELKGGLSSGKKVAIVLSEKINETSYNIDINLFRADIIKKSSFNGETYILTMEKYDTDYPGDKDGGCLIDERLIFYKVEDAIGYLNKKQILKKKDWIIKDGK